jgi:two-component system, NarL family, nitrate/nitrite response regulator NarL
MRVAVLAERSLFRAGLVTLLTTLGFEHVVEVASLEELKGQTTCNGEFEMLLVHLSGETEDVHQRMQEIRQRQSNVKVVFLSNKLDVKLMSDCFAAGGSGYLLENLSRDALHKSLTLARTGEKVFPSELASFIVDLGGAKQVSDTTTQSELQRLGLSNREVEVLRLLASGDSNKLIAAKLDIRESTVKVHLKQILRKTRTFNRTQAALWALHRGIVLEKSDDNSNTPTRHNPSSVRPAPAAAKHEHNPERGQPLERAVCSPASSSETELADAT